MIIRSLEKNDQSHVEEIMAGHPLQFPKFVVEKYPPRWNAFLTVQDDKLCGYYVALEHACEVIGHAGYVLNDEATLSFYRNIGFEMVNHEKDFFESDYHRVTFIKSI